MEFPGYCTGCPKREKLDTTRTDPKHLIVPAKFYPKERIAPMTDAGLLREIVNLDTTMKHSMAEYNVNDNDPEYHNYTYPSVRYARERIEDQIKKSDSYKIINFGIISALAKNEHEPFINEIISKVKEDSSIESFLFGKEVGFSDTIAWKTKDASHNCWIFLKEEEDFILFVNEYEDQIKKFFLNN